MIFWIAVAVLSALVGAAIAWPLILGKSDGRDEADFDIEVFRDQLSEVGREQAEGRLDYAEAEAAKAEISRRILAADNARSGDSRFNRRQPAAAAALVALLIGGTVVAYLQVGAPGQPARPFAEREDERRHQTAQRDGDQMDLSSLAKRLKDRLERDPDNAQGWQLLARTFMTMGDFRSAIPAYERLIELDDAIAGVYAAYGEALALAADGAVTPKSRGAFRIALDRNAKEPTARYYMGLADWQAGSHREAYDMWSALLAESPADAPWTVATRQRLEKASDKLGFDVAALPKPLPASQPQTQSRPGGPSREDMAAAQQMSLEDRQQMIRGMVAGLAAKLEENPSNFEGWMQLIRSYGVLGEREEAKAALDKAMAQFANAPFVKRQLQALAGELGLAEAASDAPRGPTAEDMRAAQDMSAEDRREMIEGMVAGLAAKLEENPGNFEGWMRLIRSYGVLGETDKAKAALEKALTQFANAPFPKRQLQALAGELGLADVESAAPRGPSAEDMRAAQDMSPEDQREMIEGMVARLAARLEENPNDLQGWVRLARSYTVLGKRIDARDAMAKAVAAAPDNVEILTLYARAIRSAAGNTPTTGSVEIMQKVLSIDPTNVEALFFAGLAAAGAGDAAEAGQLWKKAQAGVPAGSDEYKALQRQIDGLAK